MKRRSLLRGAAPLCAGLAGCSGAVSDPLMLSVIVFNHAESPYTVEVTLSRTDATTRSDARAFSGTIDVEPDGQADREGVAERRRYLIEYGLYEDNSDLTDQDHVHYYPGDEDESGTLSFDIDSSGNLTRR
ncbi:hypothetical protein C471_04765 [Halorubrum saccharovorum DSM 1137]|uniref:Lipoprotein n=1 Tax=Halorubrum saccharovorum DSM 1137 TaxID=1227484 RepID=M0E7H5_9EURY|nr:hypothetical protein [Halorubrum saccharovorum]ELZ42324.1 hypothetical protein C471_04765 [Halorubrum saccharovorum DSM 1137]